MFLVIYGPTAVGKTDFAIQLAEQCNGLMVNADVGQLYKPLSIGTAKPDLSSIRIPHCLFDVLDEPRDYSVVEFREKVIACIHDSNAKHLLPIVTGGSGFYISSLFFPPRVAAYDKQQFDGKTTEMLWQELNQIDPQRAQSIKPTDRYRIERALNIWYSTKQLPSTMQPTFDPPDSFGFIMLTREREDLYERINKRVQDMFTAGWIDEVRALQDSTWHTFLKKKKLVGYSEIIEYLSKSDDDINTLIADIAQKTRNYAKRQMTFGRMLVNKLQKQIVDKPDHLIETINLTRVNESLALHIIIDTIKNRLGKVNKSH